METRRQGTTLSTGICVLIGLLVVIQLWLVAACFDALLGATRRFFPPRPPPRS